MTNNDPGSELLRAVADAVAKNPARFPPRSTGEIGPETLGWTIPDDLDGEQLAILTTELREIARTRQVAHVGAVLKQLARRGYLVPSGENGGRLARRVRVGTSQPRVYIFRTSQLEQAPAGARQAIDVHEGLNKAIADTGMPAQHIVQEALREWLSERGYLDTADTP